MLELLDGLVVMSPAELDGREKPRSAPSH